VIAPHGGLCVRDLLAPETAGTLRGNDLHTAEVASLLAERLDASLIANLSVDRNELDLNRISEIAAVAPWFLDLIQEQVEHILRRHPVAQVLVVHGWHVVQPRCDVGVGARLADADEATLVRGRLTVSPDYVLGPLEALRAAGERHGIRTTYGERWPAAHRNNVMQLFRQALRAVPGAVSHPLAQLASDGRLQAVQLELGAPLRWPGVWRDRFLAIAAVAFAPATAQPGGPEARVVAVADAGEGRRASAPVELDRPRAIALQAFDECAGASGLGIVVGLGPMSPNELGARLLLLPGGQRMLLFTGHERIGRRPPGTVGGLEAIPGDGGITVRFRGPVLDVPDASRYFQHEAAQLDAHLVDLELDLRFTAFGASAYGHVVGEARVPGMTWRFAAQGFTDPVLARPAPRQGSALRLTASFGADLGMVASLEDAPGTGSITCLMASGRAQQAALSAVPIPAVVPGRLAEPFILSLPDGAHLRCTPRGHVTILRPSGDGIFVRVTFGAAGYELDDGRRGSGFYEHGSSLLAGGEQSEEP